MLATIEKGTLHTSPLSSNSPAILQGQYKPENSQRQGFEQPSHAEPSMKNLLARTMMEIKGHSWQGIRTMTEIYNHEERPMQEVIEIMAEALEAAGYTPADVRAGHERFLKVFSGGKPIYYRQFLTFTQEAAQVADATPSQADYLALDAELLAIINLPSPEPEAEEAEEAEETYEEYVRRMDEGKPKRMQLWPKIAHQYA